MTHAMKKSPQKGEGVDGRKGRGWMEGEWGVRRTYDLAGEKIN